MGLFLSHLKLKMSKNQTDHVASKSTPAPEPSISHHCPVPMLRGGKLGN